jgi:hypothetical protein
MERRFVVVLRDGNRMLANSLESAQAKLKKYGGRTIRPATKQEVTTHDIVASAAAFRAGANAAMARLITLDDVLNGAETLRDLVGTA